MTVPDYQAMTRPTLKVLDDPGRQQFRTIIDVVAELLVHERLRRQRPQPLTLHIDAIQAGRGSGWRTRASV